MTSSKSPALVLAEFGNPRELRRACEHLRDQGLGDWDAHSPFPVHGLSRAMGLRESPLGWIVFVAAMLGALGGFGLQWWVSSVAYPHNVSGKPFFSWPAFIPVTFELAVLAGALAAVGGLFWLARLPHFHHRLFDSARFESASDDGFFISVAAEGAAEIDRVTELLTTLGASHLEVLP